MSVSSGRQPASCQTKTSSQRATSVGEGGRAAEGRGGLGDIMEGGCTNFSQHVRAIFGISSCHTQGDQTDKLDEKCTQSFVICSIFRSYNLVPELTIQHMRVLRCSFFACNKKHRIWQIGHSKTTTWTCFGPTLQLIEFSTAALLLKLCWPSSNLDLQHTTYANLQSAGK